MFCSKCGSQIPDGSRFCPACGTQVMQPTAYQQPVQPPVQQPVQPPEYPQGMYQEPLQKVQAKVPWHSRGKRSPLYPGARRINVLFVTLLTVMQAVLFFIFAGIGDTVEADMMTAQLVGLVPTVVLIVYLFNLDTIEKEPVSLLLKLFFVEGLLTMLIVAYVELAMESVALVFLDEDTVLFHIVDNLLCVALVEELFKFCVLKKFTWRHSAFNYRFDGVVYAAVTALGFAAFENFAYIDSYGFSVALTRMVSSVPGHCVDGILMGIFYGKAKLMEGRGNHAGARKNLLFALLAPIAEHGFYDFFANFGESDLAFLLFYGYVFILNAVVFVLVWRLAQRDEAIYAQEQMNTPVGAPF